MILLGLYLIGAVVAARVITAAVLNKWEEDGGGIDTTDQVTARCMGCLLALIWPFALVGALATWTPPKTAAKEQK